MNFIGTINAGMTKLARSMKDGTDNCKLDGKIAECQNRIQTLTKEIGNLTVIRLEAGDEMNPEIMERYVAIQEAKEMISELEKEKKRTMVICQACGAKTSVNMKFCGVCGTRLDEE